ncbi:hypothetical protein EOPP23_10565 [Endozoicomonas sp. OPT23]|uniref:hypothetical protein n=1 Tax=Endozoicomonas sp. OPT23 TaxID=2072845 RepID=UPI00129B9E03|nr:hypothetical protein [Endozoicomonas sp. OPT23]MRI33427.1 hypothetical protein [Endozoicomonas sp. OPT23]
MVEFPAGAFPKNTQTDVRFMTSFDAGRLFPELSDHYELHSAIYILMVGQPTQERIRVALQHVKTGRTEELNNKAKNNQLLIVCRNCDVETGLTPLEEKPIDVFYEQEYSNADGVTRLGRYCSFRAEITSRLIFCVCHKKYWGE